MDWTPVASAAVAGVAGVWIATVTIGRWRDRPLPFLAVMVASFSVFPTFADLRRHPFALWYPTFFGDPTPTFVFQSSASGDYDQP